MLDLIWNLFQDDDIKRLRSGVAIREAQSDALRSQVGSVEARLLELEKRHEQLKLVTLALWRLLKDQVELSELNLKKYVESTDLLDGEADGKVDLMKELIECPDCGRFLLNTAIVCPYCGATTRRAIHSTLCRSKPVETECRGISMLQWSSVEFSSFQWNGRAEESSRVPPSQKCSIRGEVDAVGHGEDMNDLAALALRRSQMPA